MKLNCEVADIFPKHNWNLQDTMALFKMSFNDLLFEAARIHRQHFSPNHVQISTLLSIKTGSCPEDCKYCPQSARYNTNLKKEALMSVDVVVEKAKAAKASGATRFCMGAAWRNLNDRDLPQMVAMISEVKALGLETCVTLGMITETQAGHLKEAGLDFYNHNLDSSEEYYKQIITSRTYQDRLDTLANVRNAGINVCCGGIIGMGEAVEDRANMLVTLANFDPQPESVPINLLIRVEGTPMNDVAPVDIFDFIRTIAVVRVMMPKSFVRLSAGREDMSDEAQALCYLAGANSIFYGEKLLTTKNPAMEKDQQLFARLGLEVLC